MKLSDHANNDVGLVLTMGPVHGQQMALGIKIVLDKIARREFGSRVFQGRREHS